MHCTLKTLEIVEPICEQTGTCRYWTDFLPASKGGSSDLPALARTSTALLNPALDELWRHQDTIVNLLKCMPADLWDIRDIEVPGKNAFIQPLRQLDINSAFLEALSVCLPGNWIFPNLQALQWGAGPSEAFHHVRLFLTPRLSHLYIHSFETVSHLCILLDLSVKYPLLINVHIRVFPNAWNSYIGLYPFSYAGCCASHLLRSPLSSCRLAEFVLDRADDTILDPDDNSDPPTAATSAQFYSTLAQHVSHSALRILTREADFTYPLVDATPDLQLSCTVDVSTIRPLFFFANLVTVNLSHSVGFNLDDVAVRDIARAWPRIEDLTLQARGYHPGHPRVTLVLYPCNSGIHSYSNFRISGPSGSGSQSTCMVFNSIEICHIRSRHIPPAFHPLLRLVPLFLFGYSWLLFVTIWSNALGKSGFRLAPSIRTLRSTFTILPTLL
ncbi:hypothetical protein C8R43DRAFT_954755 [Mycena crocata]|nr:hypothetical protein C8R43DRAFT_954755 [Mycena crocata]